MRSFFRSLERAGVQYLLVSGQAAVLYGASAFSEDIDLWIAPTGSNMARTWRALGRCRARVHKLTPPWTLANARRGHGFHFVIPEEDGTAVYLDVMGRPPRVGSFGAASRRAQRVATDWGSLPVVSIPDLVQLKKTRRLADYDVISNLVRIHLARSRRALPWALASTFRLEDAVEMLRSFPRARSLAATSSRPWIRELASRSSRDPGDAEAFSALQPLVLAEIAVLQRSDMAYWSPILDELRALRREGALLAQGTRVTGEALP